MKSKLTFEIAQEIRREVEAVKSAKTLFTIVGKFSRIGKRGKKEVIPQHFRKSGASAMVAKRRGLPKHVVADIVRYKTFVPDCIAE